MQQVAIIQNGTESFRSTSSLQQGRHVSLGEVLSQTYFPKQQDYIEVNVVHSFLLHKPRHVECHFIFADCQTHISGILYSDDGDQYFLNLREGTKYRIKNFKFQYARNLHNNNQSRFLLRDQMKRLVLSKCVNNIEEISEQFVPHPFLINVPFQFTELNDLGKDVHHGKLIDVVGFVKNVEDKKLTPTSNPFRVVHIVRRSHNLLESPTPENHVQVGLFGRLVQEPITLGSMIGFTNISVTKNPMFNGLRLSTTNSTVMLELSLKENVTKIFPCSQYNAMLSNALGSNSLSKFFDLLRNKHQDERFNDESLSRSFSKAMKVSTEEESGTTPASITSGMSTQICLSPQPNVLTRSPLTAIPPNVHINSIVPLPVSQSPSKRTIELELLPPSPPKKVRLTPPPDGLDRANETNIKESPSVQHSHHQFYDFINQTHPYEVTVTPARDYCDTKPDAYPMRSKMRGKALIINNFFLGLGRKERQGSHFDVVYLTEFLTKCKFDVTTKRDLKSWELRSTIKAYKEKLLNDGTDKFDALLIAVLSHGVQGTVEMADEKMIPLFEDIIHQFDEHNFPALAEKPKVFLVQACQNLPTIHDVQNRMQVMTQPQKRKLKNIIVCYGTSPGTVSYRDTYLGSYFIYVLVDILMKNSHNCHFEKMLKMTQKALENVRGNKDDQPTCMWTPFMFNKMYFNPGL